MGRVEKTVFISYRRTNIPWALAIFQNLTQNGYDVFFDFDGIASGDFERVILENIRGRAHFLILLTPSALERCDDPADWLRREIEAALDSERNIVPLMLEGFWFGTPTIAKQLKGNLAQLKRYNALSIPPEYFFEAMGKLREKFLSIALDEVPHPASVGALKAANAQKGASKMAPAVTEEELTAQQWFERGFNAEDLSEKVRFYSQAIRLKPDYAGAFVNRGAARDNRGDPDGALEDFNEAIRLQPDYALAFYNRGNTRSARGDLASALEDYSQAIRLKADYSDAFFNRGNTRGALGDFHGAVEDYDEAIHLGPEDATAFNNRGNARKAKGDLVGALEDYNQAIRLRPDHALAYNNRANVRYAKGDLEGAVEDYNEAIRLKPDYADAYDNRSVVLDAKGDLEGAAEDSEQATRLRNAVNE